MADASEGPLAVSPVRVDAPKRPEDAPNVLDRGIASAAASPAPSRPSSVRLAQASASANSRPPSAAPSRAGSRPPSVRVERVDGAADLSSPMLSKSAIVHTAPSSSSASRPASAKFTSPPVSRPASVKLSPSETPLAPEVLPRSRPGSARFDGARAGSGLGHGTSDAESLVRQLSHKHLARPLSVSVDSAPSTHLGPPSSPVNTPVYPSSRGGSPGPPSSWNRAQTESEVRLRASSANWTTEHDASEGRKPHHPLALYTRKDDSPHSSYRSHGSANGSARGSDLAISPLGSPKGENIPSSEGERMSRHSSRVDGGNITPPGTPPRKTVDDLDDDAASSLVADRDERVAPRPISDPVPDAKPKILNLMGREVGPPKAMALLGSPTMDRSSMRLADDALKAELAKQSQRRLQTVLLQHPTDSQTAIPAHRSLKAALMLGEPKLAAGSAKPHAVLGADALEDIAARRAADSAEVEEREKEAKAATLATLSRRTPTKEQIRLPPAQELRPISLKALAVLGDQQLQSEAVRLGGIAHMREQSIGDASKAAQVFGSTLVASPKARERMGSSDDDDEARRLADRALAREREEQRKEAIEAVLQARPSPEQLEVKSPVADKALAVLGDQLLAQAAKEFMPVGRAVSPKAVHVLGDPKLAGKKASKTVGSSELDTKARKRANDEWRKFFRSTSFTGSKPGTEG